MDKKDIKRIMESDSVMTETGMFKGVFAGYDGLAEYSLPIQAGKGAAAYVVNTMGHWIALYFNGYGQCDFMDSFGRPLEHLDFPDSLRRFVIRNCEVVSSNKYCVQSKHSSSCGMYVATFLRLKARGVSMDGFAKLMWSGLEEGNMLMDLIMYSLAREVWDIEMDEKDTFKEVKLGFIQKLLTCRGLPGHRAAFSLRVTSQLPYDLRRLFELQDTKECFKLKQELVDKHSCTSSTCFYRQG